MRTNPAICRFLCTAALLFGFSFLPARAAGQLQEVWEYDSAGNVLGHRAMSALFWGLGDLGVGR